VLGKPLRG